MAVEKFGPREIQGTKVVVPVDYLVGEKLNVKTGEKTAVDVENNSST